MGKICKDLFRNFPDFKGIKTSDLMSDAWFLLSLETSLTSKGLRPLPEALDTTLISLETSLTSKGLRPKLSPR